MTTPQPHRPAPAQQLPRGVAALAAVLAVLAALLGATACSDGDKPAMTRADLAARPRLEEVVARYEQMQQRIRDALDAELGPRGWRPVRDQTPNGCGHDAPAGADGRSLFMAPWGFDAPVPDADWTRVSDIVTDIASEYGFATTGVSIEKPGYHLLNGVDAELGARYRFGSQVATTFQVTTGCHLPAGAPGA